MRSAPSKGRNCIFAERPGLCVKAGSRGRWKQPTSSLAGILVPAKREAVAPQGLGVSPEAGGVTIADIAASFSRLASMGLMYDFFTASSVLATYLHIASRH